MIKSWKHFPTVISSAPEVFLCFWSFDLVKELMGGGGVFLKTFFDKIFVKCCFSLSAWCSTLQCLVALILDGRNFWLLAMRTFILQGHANDTLEFQGLQWSSLKWTSLGQVIKKDALHGLMKHFKGAQHSFERAQQKCVEQLASPPAFSWTDVCQSDENKLAALLLRVVYLYTVVKPRIKAQTLSIDIDLLCPICTLDILYWSLLKTCTFPLGLTETSECLCTVIPTVVHLCCTRAWWGRGEADKSSSHFGDLCKNTALKKETTKKAFTLRPAVVTLGRIALLNNTVVHWGKDILWNSL